MAKSTAIADLLLKIPVVWLSLTPIISELLTWKKHAHSTGISPVRWDFLSFPVVSPGKEVLGILSMEHNNKNLTGLLTLPLKKKS